MYFSGVADNDSLSYEGVLVKCSPLLPFITIVENIFDLADPIFLIDVFLDLVILDVNSFLIDRLDFLWVEYFGELGVKKSLF